MNYSSLRCSKTILLQRPDFPPALKITIVQVPAHWNSALQSAVSFVVSRKHAPYYGLLPFLQGLPGLRPLRPRLRLRPRRRPAARLDDQERGQEGEEAGRGGI